MVKSPPDKGPKAFLALSLLLSLLFISTSLAETLGKLLTHDVDNHIIYRGKPISIIIHDNSILQVEAFYLQRPQKIEDSAVIFSAGTWSVKRDPSNSLNSLPIIIPYSHQLINTAADGSYDLVPVPFDTEKVHADKDLMGVWSGLLLKFSASDSSNRLRQHREVQIPFYIVSPDSYAQNFLPNAKPCGPNSVTIVPGLGCECQPKFKIPLSGTIATTTFHFGPQCKTPATLRMLSDLDDASRVTWKEVPLTDKQVMLDVRNGAELSFNTTFSSQYSCTFSPHSDFPTGLAQQVVHATSNSFRGPQWSGNPKILTEQYFSFRCDSKNSVEGSVRFLPLRVMDPQLYYIYSTDTCSDALKYGAFCRPNASCNTILPTVRYSETNDSASVSITFSVDTEALPVGVQTSINVFFRTPNNQVHFVPSTPFQPFHIKNGARLTLTMPPLPPNIEFEAVVASGWDGSTGSPGSFDGCRWIPPGASGTALFSSTTPASTGGVTLKFAHSPVKRYAYSHQAIVFENNGKNDPATLTVKMPPIFAPSTNEKRQVFPLLPDEPSWALGSKPLRYGYTPVLSPISIVPGGQIRVYSTQTAANTNGVKWYLNNVYIPTSTVCPTIHPPATRLIQDAGFGFSISNWQSDWVSAEGPQPPADDFLGANMHLMYGASAPLNETYTQKWDQDPTQLVVDVSPAGSELLTELLGDSFSIGYEYQSPVAPQTCPKVPVKFVPPTPCPFKFPTDQPLKCYQQDTGSQSIDCLLQMDWTGLRDYPLREIIRKGFLPGFHTAPKPAPRTFHADRITLRYDGNLRWEVATPNPTRPLKPYEGLFIRYNNDEELCLPQDAKNYKMEIIPPPTCQIFFVTERVMELYPTTTAGTTSFIIQIPFGTIPSTADLSSMGPITLSAQANNSPTQWTGVILGRTLVATSVTISQPPKTNTNFLFTFKAGDCSREFEVKLFGIPKKCPFDWFPKQIQTLGLTAGALINQVEFPFTLPNTYPFDDFINNISMSVVSQPPGYSAGWVWSYDVGQKKILLNAGPGFTFANSLVIIAFTFSHLDNTADCTSFDLKAYFSPSCGACSAIGTQNCSLDSTGQHICHCLPEWTGTWCNIPVKCMAGTKPCGEIGTDSCGPTDCKCLTGFGGDNCLCKPADCSQLGQGWECSTTGNDCVCKANWGPPGQCDVENPCKHGCDKDGAVECTNPCQCNPGFFGQFCRCSATQCPLNSSCIPTGTEPGDCACDSGFTQVDKVCQKDIICQGQKCSSPGSQSGCDPNGACLCKPGWSGSTCECGPDTCENFYTSGHAACNDKGVCTCLPGWVPQPPGDKKDSCSKPATCDGQCNQDGTEECGPTSSNPNKCQCRDPWTGPTCSCRDDRCPTNQVCAVNGLDDDCHCLSPNILVSTGECSTPSPSPCRPCASIGTESCSATRCMCKKDWYGDACDVKCINSECGKNSKCSPAGDCVCETGWTADHDGKCTINTEDLCGCEKEGTQKCDPLTGLCTCKTGFVGDRCECNSAKCPANAICPPHGGRCECDLTIAVENSKGECILTPCPGIQCHAPGTSGCGPNKDTCVCKPGWEGPECQCKKENCPGHGQCNSSTGNCECQDGWRFPPPEGDCSRVSVCPGKDCNMGGTKECGPVGGPCVCDSLHSGPLCSCPLCPSRAKCNSVSLQCECENLWEGTNCDVCVFEGRCLNGGKPDKKCTSCECKKGWTNPSAWLSNYDQRCQCRGAQGEVVLKAYNDSVLSTGGLAQSELVVFDGARYAAAPSTSALTADESLLMAIMRDVFEGILQALIPRVHAKRDYSYSLTPKDIDGIKSTVFSFIIPYGCPEANEEWRTLADLKQPWISFQEDFAEIPQIKKWFKTATASCEEVSCQIDPGKPLVPTSSFAYQNASSVIVITFVVILSVWAF